MCEGVCAARSASSYTRWSKTSALDGHSATHPYVCVFHIQNTHTHTHTHWCTNTHMKSNMFLDDGPWWWRLSFLPLVSGHLGDLKQTPAGVRSCFCNHIHFLWSPRTVCVCSRWVSLKPYSEKHTGGGVGLHTLTDSTISAIVHAFSTRSFADFLPL